MKNHKEIGGDSSVGIVIRPPRELRCNSLLTQGIFLIPQSLHWLWSPSRLGRSSQGKAAGTSI